MFAFSRALESSALKTFSHSSNFFYRSVWSYSWFVIRFYYSAFCCFSCSLIIFISASSSVFVLSSSVSFKWVLALALSCFSSAFFYSSICYNHRMMSAKIIELTCSRDYWVSLCSWIFESLSALSWRNSSISCSILLMFCSFVPYSDFTSRISSCNAISVSDGNCKGAYLEIANLTDRALRVFLVIVQLVLELFVLLLLGLGELLHIVCPVKELAELLLDGANCGNLSIKLRSEILSSFE